MDDTAGIDRDLGAEYPEPTSEVGRPKGRTVDRGRPTSILFIDPRPLTRECLSRWLAASARNFRVISVATPADISNTEALRHQVDLMLFNIAGAEVTAGWVAEAVALLRRALPDVPVAVLSDREEVEHIVAAVQHGVRGYIPTSLPLPAAIEALRFVRAGGTFVPASALVERARRDDRAEGGRPGRDRGPGDDAAAGAAGPAALDGFTVRETEVLARLCEGKPNKIIAYELDIRDSTVKVHVRHIMKKLRASNRTQVAYLARRLFERRAGGGPGNAGRPPADDGVSGAEG